MIRSANPMLVRFLLAALVLVAIAAAFYAGFRLPNTWSINYWQINVFDGFSRRSMLGSVLYPLGCQLFNPAVIHLFQGTTLAAVIVLLVWFGRRDHLPVLIAITFFSAAGGFLFHEVGYVDQVLWLVTLVAMLCAWMRWDILAGLVMGGSVLVHEMAVFIVLPLTLAFVVISGPVTVRRLLELFLVPVALFGLIYIRFQTIDQAKVFAYMERASQCGFPVERDDYFQVFLNPFVDRAQIYYTTTQLFTHVLPLVVLAGVVALVIRDALRLGVLESLVLFGAGIAPIALGIMGWDVFRWMFLAWFQTLMVVLLAARRVPEVGRDLRILAAFAVAALILRLDYFDGLSPRPLETAAIVDFWTNLSAHLDGR